jgi:hypothetical protein
MFRRHKFNEVDLICAHPPFAAVHRDPHLSPLIKLMRRRYKLNKVSSMRPARVNGKVSQLERKASVHLQGCLDHKKLSPLGPYCRTIPGLLWWS